jgi:hypothetical protein
MDRFGWTLEYVDTMDACEAYRIIDIVQSADKAHADEQRKRSKHGR